MGLPRRYSTRPLPGYRYVPGRTPHPTRHPRGHSFGTAEVGQGLRPEAWSGCETYLLGIDLFNRRYWWEAHEALEGLWREAGRGSQTGQLLQGVIQVAAALLKREMGEERAARRLAAVGSAKLRCAPAGLLGIDGGRLADEVEGYLEGRREAPPVIALRGLDPPPRGPGGGLG